MARLEDKLAMSLYRVNCPDSTELGEYHLGMVSDERAWFIKQHLNTCPHCALDIAQLKDYLAGLAPELETGPLERVQERVRVLVARLVSGAAGDGPAGRPTLIPAYAGVRGEEGGPLVYQSDDVQVVIEVHRDSDHPDRTTVLGLAIGLDDPQRFKAHLWQGDQPVITIPVDELGNFVFPNLVPARYELILSGPEVEIHIQDLPVGTPGSESSSG